MLSAGETEVWRLFARGNEIKSDNNYDVFLSVWFKKMRENVTVPTRRENLEHREAQSRIPNILGLGCAEGEDGEGVGRGRMSGL